MGNAVHSPWTEPRPMQPPTRVWRDWVLVAVLVPAAVLDGILREELVWRPIALVIGVALVLTVLWRRTKPLAVVAAGFGALAAAHVVTLFGADGSVELYSSVYVILLPYSLLRWGARREVTIGLAIIVVGVVTVGLTEQSPGFTLDTMIDFVIFLVVSAVLGASVRSRVSSQFSEIDRVKIREREQLARELHDSVAHHVSAISIQAQAGRTLARSHPDAALDALKTIEEAASRTLDEMRVMVGVLREREAPNRSPQRGVGDIERLANAGGDSPRVDVELSGDLDDLRPSVDAALYRLAQESITNAVRHARHVTLIKVRVAGDDDCVRLTVSDDGDTSSIGRSSSGYGLVGMTERATLLGGTLEAGPGGGRGWTVNALLPRAGSIV